MAFIHSYGYDPEWKYHGNPRNHLLMGVELEVDFGGEDEDKAAEVLEILNGSRYSEVNAYIKHDGSLRDGFEIVSQPATLKYHTTKIPWQAAFDYLRRNGYRSGSTSTCGLHIHVNRLYFGKTEDEIVNNEAKLLWFFETYWRKLVIFSRRKPEQISRWCARYGHTNFEQAIEDNRDSRYYALNFRNFATDEIRLFKGTLVYSIFEATLRLVYNIVRYCKAKSLEALQQEKWENFLLFILKDAEKNKPLIDYMMARGIW